MDYTLPEFIKDELIYGDTSDNIDMALDEVNLDDIPQFKHIPREELKQYIQGFLGYKYLTINSEIEQIVYLKLLKSTEIELFVIPTIEEFKKIIINSSMSDQTIKNQVAKAKLRYMKLARNCFKKEFEEYSKKFDKKFYDQAFKAIKDDSLSIVPEQLVTLIKCAIIEERTNPDSELSQTGMIGEFVNIEDVINFVYYIYIECNISFEDRKEEVNKDIQIIRDVISIVHNNGFTR